MTLEPHRAELAGQEIRQFQLIETVVARYGAKRTHCPPLVVLRKCCPAA
jgi:hypothetical protein